MKKIKKIFFKIILIVTISNIYSAEIDTIEKKCAEEYFKVGVTFIFGCISGFIVSRITNQAINERREAVYIEDQVEIIKGVNMITNIDIDRYFFYQYRDVPTQFFHGYIIGNTDILSLIIAVDANIQKPSYTENRAEMLAERMIGKNPEKLRQILRLPKSQANITEFLNGRGSFINNFLEYVGLSKKRDNVRFIIY